MLLDLLSWCPVSNVAEDGGRSRRYARSWATLIARGQLFYIANPNASVSGGATCPTVLRGGIAVTQTGGSVVITQSLVP